jgi:hypothetical protein
MSDSMPIIDAAVSLCSSKYGIEDGHSKNYILTRAVLKWWQGPPAIPHKTILFVMKPCALLFL